MSDLEPTFWEASYTETYSTKGMIIDIFIHHASPHVRHGFPRRVAASVVGVELSESRRGD